MALSWSIDKIENYKTVCWDDEGNLRPLTETLIFGTMSVGLGSITDKNVDEFAARFRIMEKIHGAFLYKIVDGKREDWFVSDEDFIAHIGLGCNVTDETRSKWAKRIFVDNQTGITEEYARNFRRERERVTA